MKFKKFIVFLFIASLISTVICLLWKPTQYEEQLIYVQVEEELAYLDKNIVNEPIDVQITLLNYSERKKELALKAWFGISKFAKAKKILQLYGSEPDFQEILTKYGDSIFPPIQYFMENDIWSVNAGSSVSEGIQKIEDFAENFFSSDAGARTKPNNSDSINQFQNSESKSAQNGQIAIWNIKQEGYHFLGQFAVDKDNQVKWNQTDRVMQGLNTFIAGGLRTLESKHDVGDEITAGDVFWSGADVVGVIAPLKLLKLGKALTMSGKQLSIVRRTGIFGTKLVSKIKIFQKLGKYGAVTATAFIIATHPTLLNSIFDEIANKMKVFSWLFRYAAWSFIIMIVLYPTSWLLKAFAKFTLAVNAWFERTKKEPTARVD